MKQVLCQHYLIGISTLLISMTIYQTHFHSCKMQYTTLPNSVVCNSLWHKQDAERTQLHVHPPPSSTPPTCLPSTAKRMLQPYRSSAALTYIAIQGYPLHCRRACFTCARTNQSTPTAFVSKKNSFHYSTTKIYTPCANITLWKGVSKINGKKRKVS